MHEVKWFALYHSPAAIKASGNQPQSMSPGAREIRSGQAKGESSRRWKMRLLLASAPFFTTFPWYLLSAGIYLRGGG